MNNREYVLSPGVVLLHRKEADPAQRYDQTETNLCFLVEDETNAQHPEVLARIVPLSARTVLDHEAAALRAYHSSPDTMPAEGLPQVRVPRSLYLHVQDDEVLHVTELPDGQSGATIALAELAPQTIMAAMCSLVTMVERCHRAGFAIGGLDLSSLTWTRAERSIVPDGSSDLPDSVPQTIIDSLWVIDFAKAGALRGNDGGEVDLAAKDLRDIARLAIRLLSGRDFDELFPANRPVNPATLSTLNPSATEFWVVLHRLGLEQGSGDGTTVEAAETALWLKRLQSSLTQSNHRELLSTILSPGHGQTTAFLTQLATDLRSLLGEGMDEETLVLRLAIAVEVEPDGAWLPFCLAALADLATKAAYSGAVLERFDDPAEQRLLEQMALDHRSELIGGTADRPPVTEERFDHLTLQLNPLNRSYSGIQVKRRSAEPQPPEQACAIQQPETEPKVDREMKALVVLAIGFTVFIATAGIATLTWILLT